MLTKLTKLKMKLFKASAETESLKGTVPQEIVKITKLKAGDELEWELIVGEKEVTWRVTKVKK